MKAVSTAASTARHVIGVALEALLLLAIVAALIFGAALLAGVSPGGADSVFAAKGGNGQGHGPGGGGGAGGNSGASISAPDGVFGGSTTATANPGGDVWVKARCYQDGKLVYYQSGQVDLSNQLVLTLGPTPLWTAGGASCTAEAGYYTSNWAWRTLATTTFQVAAQ